LNTLNMFGTGPFITCAILLQTVTPAGPQALYGYFASGVLVFFDSFVWGELSSIWPYTGGSYAYLSEMYGRDTWGSLAAFMYLWQLLISGPLEVAGGFVAAASYLRYFAPMSDLGAQFAACGLSIFCFLGMYTGVRESARMTYFLWVLTMLAVLYVYVAGFSNLDASNFKSPSGWQKSLDWKTFGMLMYVCISKIQAHCLLPRS
jgi:amino acid transporter|tara:strand:- start:258 stop:869 length:612 start_codon:yes stop_codon:yes gene_type:complete